MGSLGDYLDWRGDLTFREAPLNEVDGLLFSLLSYLDYSSTVPQGHGEGSVPLQAVLNSFLSRHVHLKKFPMGLIFSKEVLGLIRQIKDTRRFRNVEMRAFVNEIDEVEQKQFSAVTFLPGDGTALVTFRGTDDSLVGWKEDLNMCFLPVIPAQTAAVDYLQTASENFDGDLLLAGHSKGGNLAVYSAVHSKREVRERITTTFCYDGPGFGKRILDDPIYLKMRPTVRSFVPQATLVGLLLEHDDNYTVVKSRQTGILQHDGLSWEVKGGGFVCLDKLSLGSRRNDKTLNKWIRDLSPEQREEFVNAIYQLFQVEGVHTVGDLVSMRKAWIAHSKQLDPKVHETVQRILTDLVIVSTKGRFSALLPFKKNEK